MATFKVFNKIYVGDLLLFAFRTSVIWLFTLHSLLLTSHLDSWAFPFHHLHFLISDQNAPST